MRKRMLKTGIRLALPALFLGLIVMVPGTVWAKHKSAGCKAAKAVHATAQAAYEAAKAARIDAQNKVKQIKKDLADARERKRKAIAKQAKLQQAVDEARQRMTDAKQALQDAKQDVQKAQEAYNNARSDTTGIKGFLESKTGEKIYGREEKRELQRASRQLKEAQADFDKAVSDLAKATDAQADNDQELLDAAVAEDNALKALPAARTAYNQAKKAEDEAYKAEQDALRKMRKACEHPEGYLGLLEGKDEILHRYYGNAQESNKEDILIRERGEEVTTPSTPPAGGGSACLIGSGTNCTAVSFSINDGSFLGGNTTYVLGGVTLVSNLANASTSFSGTAETGSTQTLTVSCGGTAACFFDFSVLSGASCPPLNVVFIALGGSTSATCTIN